MKLDIFRKRLFKALALVLSAGVLFTSISLPKVEASIRKPSTTKITKVSVNRNGSKPVVTVKWNKVKGATGYYLGNRSAVKHWKYIGLVKYTKKNLKKYTKAGKYKVVKYKKNGVKRFKVYRKQYIYKALKKCYKGTSASVYGKYNKNYYMIVRVYNGKYGNWSKAVKVHTGKPIPHDKTWAINKVKAFLQKDKYWHYKAGKDKFSVQNAIILDSMHVKINSDSIFYPSQYSLVSPISGKRGSTCWYVWINKGVVEDGAEITNSVVVNKITGKVVWVNAH
ncbi:MAG: hypothetical protein LBM02_06200 [Lachnospiraceae bacterium]|jgi:hypothetical protein|nr:hypothetical protein [Lachnospiraceae bacterium]